MYISMNWIRDFVDLSGLDLNADSKINDLLMDIYNISFEAYIKNAITGLDISFADSTKVIYKQPFTTSALES